MPYRMDIMSGQGFLDGLAYLARITTRDGRAVEEAMAGATLLDNGARLDGAVVEASYAFDRPPLMKRLGDDKIPRIIDPQTLRFVGENFLDVDRLIRLPFAPGQPITAASFDAKAARALSRDSMIYAQDRGADIHVAPALPLFDKDLDAWRRHNVDLLHAACAANGGADLDRRPLIAQVAPGNKALSDPAVVVDVLLDHPVDGVYVQALRLLPTADSLEKLARFVQFVVAVRDAGFRVIVGRVGSPDSGVRLRAGSRRESRLGELQSSDDGPRACQASRRRWRRPGAACVSQGTHDDAPRQSGRCDPARRGATSSLHLQPRMLSLPSDRGAQLSSSDPLPVRPAGRDRSGRWLERCGYAPARGGDPASTGC